MASPVSTFAELSLYALMEHNREFKATSKEQKISGALKKTVLPQASQMLNPRDRLPGGKAVPAHADDLHHETTKNAKQNISRKLSENRVGRESELVRYMSNLPCYLEKGEKVPEKILNVGVLDWGRLEQYSHKKIPDKSNGCSISNTTSSLPQSTVELFSRGNNSSTPAPQRLHRPSLQFHLMSSPVEPARSREFKSVGESPEFRLEKRENKDLEAKIDKGSGIMPHRLNCEVASSLRGNVTVLRAPTVLPENNLSETLESRRAKLKSDSPNSYPLSREVDSNKHVQMRRTSFTEETERNKISLDRSRSTSTGTNPSRGTNREEKKSTQIQTVSNERKPSTSATENGRSVSPFKRLSLTLGKASKSSQLRDGCVQDSSCHDKPNRAKSSPLRRLLEPLMKPNAANCGNSAEPSQKDSSNKLKLGITSCKAVNILSQEMNHGSSSIKALLRVTFKNGQPLFTFAIEKESRLLAATLKKLSTSEKKEDCSCVYTFFTIQEFKKKKNKKWRSEGGRKSYISNIVAHVRVSADFNRESCLDLCIMKEFVLFAVDLTQQAGSQASDVQPNDELAAIVIKIPKKSTNKKSVDRNDKCCNQVDKQRWFPFKEDISATVILPSGIHSLPHKGGPSSLIQRWKSGGSCDCGGWDMGCNLRILASGVQLGKKCDSSKASSTVDQFELFFSGGTQDKQPFFSYTAIKEGIYSVEFNSSLSLLQAFSVCISIWDGKKLRQLYDSSKPFEDKTSDIEATYVSYPPLSPVGRV